jgi:hypothetical protein
MIERNAGYHRAIGVVCIDRVQAPAQPDFENEDFDLTTAKDLDGSKCTELEVGQGYATGCLSRRLHPGKGLAQTGVVYR